jgi:hypothetical protein
MSNDTRHDHDRCFRYLSPAELDAVSGGAATKPKPQFPGPCFPRPKPSLEVM